MVKHDTNKKPDLTNTYYSIKNGLGLGFLIFYQYTAIQVANVECVEWII